MQQKQINLDNEPVRRNRKFMRRLFLSEIGGKYWFEKLGPPDFIHRQLDNDMTLEKYITNLRKGSMIGIRTLGDQYKLGKEEFIEFMASDVYLIDSLNINRFAFWEVPLIEENYNQMAKIFKSVYGKEY